MERRERSWYKSSKALKVLAWKVKRKEALRLVHQIRAEDGKLNYISNDIMKTFESYYHSLYSSTNPMSNSIAPFLADSI